MDWSPFNNSFSIGWSVCAASGRGQKFAPSCGLALLSAGWLTEFLHNGASAVKDNVGVIRTRCGFPCRQPSNASPRNWKIARTHSKKKKADGLAKIHHLSPGQTVLPAQANSSQVHNFDGVGCRLAAH